MKLQRHKFKYNQYLYDLDTGTMVPVECHLEYVLPIDVERLESAFAQTKKQLAEAEELVDFLNRQIG